MSTINDEQIAALQEKYPDNVTVLRCGTEQSPIEIAVRRPSRGEWKRVRSLMATGQAGDAESWLAKTCALYPTGADLDAIYDRFPALQDLVGEAIGRLATGGSKPAPKE